MKEKIKFNSDNLELEGVLEKCAREKESGAGVVICHPHPHLGGSMDNNVTFAVSRALTGRGIIALRFNFRGTGRSEGAYDEGKGEIEDVISAVNFLESCKGVEPGRTGIMGYSFGGAVALAAAMQENAGKAVAAVAPTGLPDFNSAKPRLIVCGGDDELVSPSLIYQHEETIAGEGEGEIKVVKGADHFWAGQEEELGEIIADFFAVHLF